MGNKNSFKSVYAEIRPWVVTKQNFTTPFKCSARSGLSELIGIATQWLKLGNYEVHFTMRDFDNQQGHSAIVYKIDPQAGRQLFIVYHLVFVNPNKSLSC